MPSVVKCPKCGAGENQSVRKAKNNTKSQRGQAAWSGAAPVESVTRTYKCGPCGHAYSKTTKS
jgi:rubredoxin